MKTNNETEENNQYKQVYKSNNEIPFEVWFAPRDAEIAWPFVAEAPDPSLKSPKYDWQLIGGMKIMKPVKDNSLNS